jgi:selenocysteine lyase/cysteine desulfurase
MIKDVSLRKLLMLDYLINLKQEHRMLVESFRNCRRLNEVGFENIQKQELELLDYGTRLLEIEGLKILVQQKRKPL